MFLLRSLIRDDEDCRYYNASLIYGEYKNNGKPFVYGKQLFMPVGEIDLNTAHKDITCRISNITEIAKVSPASILYRYRLSGEEKYRYHIRRFEKTPYFDLNVRGSKVVVKSEVQIFNTWSESIQQITAKPCEVFYTAKFVDQGLPRIHNLEVIGLRYRVIWNNGQSFEGSLDYVDDLPWDEFNNGRIAYTGT